ncbi:MAG: PEP-CTERM sorting domain-containing protein, partial [Burkholderiales bacterium]
WDGGGGTDNWSNENNWNGNTDIANNSSLTFAGATRLNAVNNLPNPDNPLGGITTLSVNGLSFAAGAGAFTLSGNPFISNGNITNSSNNLQTLNTPVIVGAPQTWSAGTPGLVFGGGISFAAGSSALTVTGSGSITSLGNITNRSGNLQTINAPITVGTSQTWDGGSAGMTFYHPTLGSNTLTLRNSTHVTGSSFWRLEAGAFGTAAINIESSSKVDSYQGYVGGLPGGGSGIGTVTVTGLGSTWSNRSALFVGFSGSGTLNILSGGLVTNGIWGRIGSEASGIGIVTVAGLGSSWESSSDLYVGHAGNGNLSIEAQGKVTNTNGFIGFQSGSTGIASVTGPGSTWLNYSDLQVGINGRGTLNINPGGMVSAGGNVSVGALGTLNLAGGTLQSGSVLASPGGHFNWTAGTLDLRAPVVLLGRDVPGNALSLDTGKHLRVANTLDVGANALFLNGGTVGAATLTLGGGTVAAAPGAGLDMDLVGTLSGHGSVNARVLNGTGKTINASGGALALGQLGSSSGFDYRGALNVGSNQVLLLSAAKAVLGSSTSIGDGGRLVTVNGAELASGRTLSFTGNASIQGEFTNNGGVSRSGPAGTLTFHNDVTGAGNFAGDIVFRAGYSPGNSPATVDFNGGDVTYDSNALLTIEILGNSPGTQYDQLVGINTLTFNGRLSVMFGNGFAPAAGSFQLFGFQSFAGSLAPDRIDVTGFDGARLDFSQLGQDGTLSVAAVPEPGSYAMMLAGLGLMGFMVSRRRRVDARLG